MNSPSRRLRGLGVEAMHSSPMRVHLVPPSSAHCTHRSICFVDSEDTCGSDMQQIAGPVREEARRCFVRVAEPEPQLALPFPYHSSSPQLVEVKSTRKRLPLTHLSHLDPSASLTHFIFKLAHFSHAEFRGCLTRFFDSGVSGIAVSAAVAAGGGGGIDGVSMFAAWYGTSSPQDYMAKAGSDAGNGCHVVFDRKRQAGYSDACG